jgi:hypothetical protein
MSCGHSNVLFGSKEGRGISYLGELLKEYTVQWDFISLWQGRMVEIKFYTYFQTGTHILVIF